MLAGTMRFPVQAAPLLQTGTADLSLMMTVNNATPTKADPVIFTITISNLSTADAVTGVTVQDVLPAGITYVSDNGGGTYNSLMGVWVVGALAANSNVTLNIITNATTTGLKTNSANILTSNLPDPDPTNNVDSVDVTPRSSDLDLTMTVDNPAPSLGDIVNFRITVTNLGPDQATGVRVTDLLPPGLSFISYTSVTNTGASGGTYTSSTGNWSVGTLNTGAGVYKRLTITASVTTTGSITNIAEVTLSDQLDPDSTPANGNISEDDYASIPLNAPSADLSVTMIVNNTTPNAADAVIFTITVSNAGPANATGVTVMDMLPAGLSYQSDNGPYDPATGIWQVGALPAGASDTLNITVLAVTVGTKTNTAEVWTSNQSDPDSSPANGQVTPPEDDRAAVSVTPNAADLSLAKTVSNSNPGVGSNVVFTITVSNSGPQGATGLTVRDLLPAGFSYVSDNGGGSYNNLSGIWTIGSLANGASTALSITARAEANPDITNKAEVWTSNQLDPDSTPGNSSISEDDDDAAPKVDLSLTKTVNSTSPSAGSNIKFTLKVKNDGPSIATNVTVLDVLPVGLSYVSSSGTGTYDSTTGIWTVGTVAVGETKTLSMTVTAVSIGTRVNSAEVWSSDQFDVDSIPGDGSTTTDDDDSLTVTVSYPPMSILINEVAWSGTAASTADEWIELYNPGSSPINLTGWVLKAVDGTPNISLLNGYILQPGEYYLLERQDDTTVSDIAADQIYSGDLGNSNETLRLLDPLNRVVDTANSNGGFWPAGTSGCSTSGCIAYGSMERRGVMNDSDTAWITNTGKVAWGLDAGIPNGCTPATPCLTVPKPLKGTPKHANWAISVVPTPLPVATPTRTPIPPPPPPPPPLLGINEFVPRPGTDWNNDGVVNTGDEYIELINHGVVNINLSGYRLDDEANIGSNPFTLPNITLKPGERIVFYGSQTGLLLSDGGDGVRLIKSNGQLADAYNYFTVEFPDQAFCRLPDNGGLDDWNTNCYPTPGLRNSLSGSILRPPTLVDNDQTLCPIADTLPYEFVLAECTPFGNNIWNRYYWDRFGWYGEVNLPNVNGKYEVYGN